MVSHGTVTVGSGETQTFRVNDGEVFEDTLFDISASGAVARLIIDGENTTVRNVAWTGVQDTTSYAVFTLSDDCGGDTLIENVYMGDGSSTGHSAGQQDPTAMMAFPGTTGDVTVRNVNVQDWGDNGLYLSNPGNAAVTIEGCYASDCANAEYRLKGGGAVRDSVVRNAFARGVWGFGPGTIDVENCHIHAPDADAFWAGEASNGGATIRVRDTEWVGGKANPYGTLDVDHSSNGSNPQDFYPQGCPATAEEAVSGGGSDGPGDGNGDGSTGDHTLVIDSTESVSSATYSVTSTGQIFHGPESEPSTDDITQNSDGTWTVTGTIGAGYPDSYSMNGEVVDHSLPTGVTASVDGADVTAPDDENGNGDGDGDGNGDGSDPAEGEMLPYLGLGLLSAAIAAEYRRRRNRR